MRTLIDFNYISDAYYFTVRKYINTADATRGITKKKTIKIHPINKKVCKNQGKRFNSFRMHSKSIDIVKGQKEEEEEE